MLKSCIFNVLWILHRCYSSNALPSTLTIPLLSTVKGKIIKCDLSECPNVSLGTLHHDRVLTLAGAETEDWWFFHNKDFQEVQRSTLTTFSITIRFMIIGSTLHSQYHTFLRHCLWDSQLGGYQLHIFHLWFWAFVFRKHSVIQYLFFAFGCTLIYLNILGDCSCGAAISG